MDLNNAASGDWEESLYKPQYIDGPIVPKADGTGAFSGTPASMKSKMNPDIFLFSACAIGDGK